MTGARMTFVLPVRMKAALEAIAAKNDRSVSAELRLLVADYIARRSRAGKGDRK